MTHTFDDLFPRRDSISIPTIWVAAALSVLLHALVLSGWMPWLHLPSLKKPEWITPPLTVRIEPLPGPPPQSAPSAPSPPAAAAPRTPPPRVAARPRSAPPVMTQAPRGASAPPPGPSAPATSAPAGDFASFVDSRRRARGEPATPEPAARAPLEDEAARRNRIAAANINPQGPIAFGYDPSRSGGVFQIDRITTDYAEFTFYGWHLSAKRNMMQRIEVNRGSNPDIRIAVVRRMIAIIRDYEQEDFRWDSHRLGRSLTLSARVRDTAGLEEFLMREFFDNPRPGR